MKTNWKIGIRISVIVCIIFLCGIFVLKIGNQNFQMRKSTQKIENQIMANTPQPKLCELETEFVPFFYLTEDEQYIVTCILASECGGEIYDGKIAVAQCILDNMIYQNKPLAEIEWMFSNWNSKLEIDSPEMWAECVNAVEDVFDNGERISEELILWFYNPQYGVSSFHQSQKFVMQIGLHHFYTHW